MSQSRRPVRTLPLRWAALGTAGAAFGILESVRRTGNNILNLIQPGQAGPSYGVIHRDFPQASVPSGLGHDGQQFYAIARQPMHWLSVAPDLDRPVYRLQRPLYPWLAWALHPQGGGSGLIDAMFVVGLAAALLGGVALALIATDHGHLAAWGLVFPILPGTLVALRISTGDTLAVALALMTVVAIDRRRIGAAIALGLAAVLAKEVVLVLLIGYALARRDRVAWATAGCAALAVAALAIALRLAVPTHGAQVQEIGAPFVGIARSVRWWAGGHDLFAGATCGLVAVVTVAAAVLGRPSGPAPSPWWFPTVLCVAYVIFVTYNTLALKLNGPRTLLPLFVAALACLLTGGRDQPDDVTSAVLGVRVGLGGDR